jgi:Transcriptional Coactivator p15 (PC4)
MPRQNHAVAGAKGKKMTTMSVQADLRGFTWLESQGVREPLAAYENDFRGAPYFHIRRMYLDGGVWRPSKQGLTCKAADKAALLQALGDYIRANRASVPA